MKQLTILSTVFLSLLMSNYAKAAKSPTLMMAGQYRIANIGENAQAKHFIIQDTLPFTALDNFIVISDSIAADRYNKNKSNMTILAAWAGVNIIQGSISATNATGSGEYFFKMNAYWNIVNLGIASWGLIQLRKELTQKYTYSQNQLAQQKLEKILLLNSGLDLAYIATGFLLKENGNRLNNLKTTGFGNSLLLQGAFLLVFDLVQYGNHRRNGKILEAQLSKLQIHASGNGIGLRLPL